MPPSPGRDDRGPVDPGGAARAGMKPAPTRGSMAIQRRLQTWWFRRCSLAGCGHPALRTRPLVRRRGGLYGRPDRVAFPAAPPPNLVGRHAHMPPWPGRNDRRPGGSGGAARAGMKPAPTRGSMAIQRRLQTWWFRRCSLAGCGHPALRTRPLVRRRGGLYGRPDRVAFPAAPPPNLVGRHAHMPPWPGRNDRRPGGSGGAARAGIKPAPTKGSMAGLV